MRPIKFRVWNGYSMVLTPEIVCRGADTIEINDVFTTKEIFMQFTGLLDKNGVEIYEGDVVRISKTYNDGEHVDSTAKVFFKDGAFQTDFHNALLRIALPGNWEVTVIGNIHENQELVK